MTDISNEEFHTDHINASVTDNPEIYKLWTRSKDISRFLSIKYFQTAKKFIIDIGTADGSNKLTGSTAVYVDAITLIAYLRALNTGTGALIYPKTKDTPTDESIAIYGGGFVDNKPIARVFKSHLWPTGNNNYDNGAFVFKCGHFDAKETSTGAFVQSSSTPISASSIKVTRKNIAEMELLLSLRIMNHV